MSRQLKGLDLLRKTETPLSRQLINTKQPPEVDQGSHSSHSCLKFIVAALYIPVYRGQQRLSCQKKIYIIGKEVESIHGW